MITLESLVEMDYLNFIALTDTIGKLNVGTAEEQHQAKLTYCRLQGKAQLLEELIEKARLVECA